ncbi:hypothetical protein OIE68_08170 [Nocardia vinacea]|uniref:Uncharacterized protein n=1 Tax=Nocardia vinacea TaxID=96468 RepID=A0ABZ1YTM8_9NOCA|nr:hypothetical protein OIE68_08170 [Nocardia vinacea]
MNQQLVFTLPQICEYADIELAHALMRRHRTCRRHRCVWKAAAYYTLMDAGRLVPQTVTPRERAVARGIAFPPLDCEPLAPGGPTLRTLHEVLDKLNELASPVPGLGGNDRGID